MGSDYKKAIETVNGLKGGGGCRRQHAPYNLSHQIVVMENHLVYDIGFVFIYIFAFGISQLFIESYALGGRKKWTFYVACLVIGLLIVYGYVFPVSPEPSSHKS